MLKFLTSKFILEIVGIATFGTIATELLFGKLILQILTLTATLFFILRKGYKDWNK